MDAREFTSSSVELDIHEKRNPLRQQYKRHLLLSEGCTSIADYFPKVTLVFRGRSKDVSIIDQHLLARLTFRNLFNNLSLNMNI